MPFYSWATHLVGGGLALKHISGTTYEIQLRLLRDCLNGTPEAYSKDNSNLYVGIFDKKTDKRITIVKLNYVSKSTLEFQGAKCATKISSCTDLSFFKASVVLSPATYNNTAGYYISWERCCRNGIINNIISPGTAAETYYMEFPSPKSIPNNSTPYFTNNPNTLLCLGNYFKYNMNYVDDDGDQLKYSLVDPLNGNLSDQIPSTNSPGPGPYKPINWINGYSAKNAIHGTPQLSINAGTGEITVMPTSVGVFVLAILIEEFRFGVKIGETYLELQFTVVACPNDPPSGVAVNDSTNKVIVKDTIYFHVPRMNCIKISADDIKDSVFLEIESPIFSDTSGTKPSVDTFVAGNKHAQTRLCWNSDCSMANKSVVPFYLTVSDNGCPIPMVSHKTFYIAFDSMPNIHATDILCLELLGNHILINWGDSTGDTNPLFNHYYLYRSTNNGPFVKIDSIYDKKLRQYDDKTASNNPTENYSYFMQSANQCNQVGFNSDTFDVADQIANKLNPLNLQYVTVIPGDSSCFISWPKSIVRSFSHYTLFRVDASGKEEAIKTTYQVNDTTFTDRGLNNDERSYCYNVLVYDTCSHVSDKGLTSCTILLKGHSVELDRYLNWSEYKGWNSGVGQYTITRGGAYSPFVQMAATVSTQLNYIDKEFVNDGEMSYYISGHQAGSAPFISLRGGPFQSRSNDIQLSFSPSIYLPNALSANGDNINDSFKWKERYLKTFSIDIYNRWGVKIFHSNDKDGAWDGMIDGQPAQIDVYFYVVHYTGFEGTEDYLKGTITLLR